MNFQTPTAKSSAIVAMFLALSFMLMLVPVQAQQPATPTAPNASAITFSGRIDSVDTRYIVVNGLLVDIQAANVPLNRLQAGADVTVTGSLQNGLIIASALQFSGDDGSSVVVTPVVPPTVVPATPIPNTGTQPATPRGSIIIIEGPVRELTPTTMRVFDMLIQLNSNTVNTSSIRVGDRVRVQGELSIANNSFSINALNIIPVNFRGSAGSNRDSVDSNRNSVNSIRDSVASNRNSVDSNRNSVDSNRDSVRQPAPPPPPPARADSSRDSVASRDSGSN